MEELTLIYPCYNNECMIEKQLALWNSYPNHIKEKIRIILVDDCSDKPLKIKGGGGVNISLFRILDKISWNQPGAKNLAFAHTQTDWIINSDIDHLVPVETLEAFLKMNKDKKTIYMFERIKPNNVIIPKPHPNSFLMHISTLSKIKGYDEDFCGNYGHDDIFFVAVIKKYFKIKMIHKYLIRYMEGKTNGLVRDPRNNEALLRKKLFKLKFGFYSNSRLLRFKWELGTIGNKIYEG